MKITYFPNQTAMQSEPVWRAFLEGCQLLGMTPVENDLSADCAVIWSVLWQGRMRLNKHVYDHFQQQNKPIFIIEVGALSRGYTWKVSVNHINSQGIYANQDKLLPNRSKDLGISLLPTKQSRKDSILIVGQHDHSLQWDGMPPMSEWFELTITRVQEFTDRPIVVRPHPRCLINRQRLTGVTFENPQKIPDTYDRFDINFDHHCVISHNSGPGIQSAISGTPLICDVSSLAWPVSSEFGQINDPKLPDREEWFNMILHTEWTVDELKQGIPQKRILEQIKS